MKHMPADGENERTEPPWPSVLPIANSAEFAQSFSVAQLAVKLCEIKLAQSNISPEVNLDPQSFLAEAWKLIESARKHVLRPALENVIGHKLRESYVPFKRLCDPERNEGDSETIHGVYWKVYRSEHGFRNLFSRYWRDSCEKLKNGDKKIGTVEEIGTSGKLRKIDFYSPTERVRLAKLARNKDAWKKRGESVLASLRRDGVPPNTFLALVKFRRERDNRAANLKKRPKRKRRRLMAKARS